MKRLCILALIALSTLYFTGCNNSSKNSTATSLDENESIIYIHEKTVLCDNGELRGVQCLQSKSNPSDEWQIYYEHIVGFQHVEGFRYKLKVKTRKLSHNEVMADASDTETTLIKILEQTLIEKEN